MTNILQRAATWLGTKLKDATVAGRTVTYKRGQLESDSIQASVTQQNYQVIDEQGFVTTVQSFDWTFTTTDLLIRSLQIVPRQGDRIRETLSGETVVYEAMMIGGRPCSEWLDTSGLLTVVHTKKVA